MELLKHQLESSVSPFEGNNVSNNRHEVESCMVSKCLSVFSFQGLKNEIGVEWLL